MVLSDHDEGNGEFFKSGFCIIENLLFWIFRISKKVHRIKD
jgi:hypothetical protein